MAGIDAKADEDYQAAVEKDRALSKKYGEPVRIAARMVGCDPGDLPTGLKMRVDRFTAIAGWQRSRLTIWAAIAVMVEQWERDTAAKEVVVGEVGRGGSGKVKA